MVMGRWFWGAHAARVLATAARRRKLFLCLCHPFGADKFLESELPARRGGGLASRAIAAEIVRDRPLLGELPRSRDYFFFGNCMTASPMHSHFPLRSIQVSTQPKERLNCFPSLSLPFSLEVPTTVARFGP